MQTEPISTTIYYYLKLILLIIIIMIKFIENFFKYITSKEKVTCWSHKTDMDIYERKVGIERHNMKHYQLTDDKSLLTAQWSRLALVINTVLPRIWIFNDRSIT